MGRYGHVKILDFSLARSLAGAAGEAGSAHTHLRTEPGTIMGMVGYMAPEQVKGEPADHRADIFAFGCVLYEIVTGRRAFERETMMIVGLRLAACAARRGVVDWMAWRPSFAGRPRHPGFFYAGFTSGTWDG